MAITYSWQITSVKTKTEGPYPQAVVQTYWTKTGTDDSGNTGSFMGATAFTTANMPEGHTFIPYEDLTEDIVLGWIKDVVVNGYETHVNQQIQRQIDEKINPAAGASLPWAKLPDAPVDIDF